MVIPRLGKAREVVQEENNGGARTGKTCFGVMRWIGCDAVWATDFSAFASGMSVSYL